MFGIGKLLGNVAGGLLDKIGLGSIAPFVKLGLNALTGNWLGVAQDVFGLVSNFKGNFLDKASSLPPLGGFDQPSNLFRGDQNPLGGSRIGDLFKGLSNLFRAFSGGGNQGGDMFGRLGKIFDAFKLLGEAFSNNQLYSNRLSISQFTNIRM